MIAVNIFITSLYAGTFFLLLKPEYSLVEFLPVLKPTAVSPVEDCLAMIFLVISRKSG